MSVSSSLIATLQAEFQTVEEFCRLLEAEHHHLERSDMDAVIAITQAKSEKIEQLNELGARRNTHLKALGRPADASGMTKWIATLPEIQSGEISDRWEALLKLANKARQLNQSNGTLISLKLGYNHAALRALSPALRNQPATYGPDGQTQHHIGSGNLGLA